VKDKGNPGGAPIGPKHNWAEWRARKDKQIVKPRRNAAAIKLNTEAASKDAELPKHG
jgi:hypothetical protein